MESLPNEEEQNNSTPTVEKEENIEENTGIDVRVIDDNEEEEDINNNGENEEDEIDMDSALDNIPLLGDRVYINSERDNIVIGTVYYRSSDLVRVLKDGVYNKLFDYPWISNEEEERFDPESGVLQAAVLKRRSFETFVEQNDMRAGDRVEAISKDGTIYNTYVIKRVNPEDDAIIIRTSENNAINDSSDDREIVFGGMGIPLEEDFIIIRKDLTPSPEDASTGIPFAEEEQVERDENEDIEPPAFKIVSVSDVYLPKQEVLKDARASDRVYTDSIQKIDALNDFLNMLDPISQKDPKEIRIIRSLIEVMNNMKREIVDYNPDGSVKGAKRTSISTLAELLMNIDVPLSRPVLAAAIKLYTEDDDIEEKTDDIQVVDFEDELLQIVENIPVVVSTKGAGNVTAHWENEKAFINKFQKPWTPSIEPRDPKFTPLVDSDFFRYDVPDLTNNQVPGYIPPSIKVDVKSKKKNESIPMPTFGYVPFSYMRSLHATPRKSNERGRVTHIPAEEATIKSYLMFPQSVAYRMGSKRTGSVAIDSGRSMNRYSTIAQVIKYLNGIKESNPTSRDIIELGVVGTTLNDISLEEYLEGIVVPGTGIGESIHALSDIGLADIELTPELFRILETKITAYQNQLVNTLSKLRDNLINMEAEKLEANPMIENSSALQNAGEEKIISDAIIVFKETNKNIASSDIALVLYLLNKYNAYFQAAMGKEPLYLIREKIRAIRDIGIERARIERLIKEAEANRGEVPIPNKCEHVPLLTAVRRLDDINERYHLLTKLFNRYQGDRDDNYINCSLCKKHLICVHERLQIHAFLNPTERDVINKELLIKFSGGVFAGNYICRNCGQPIHEIEYDMNMEYDDDGRPMVGRSVLEEGEDVEDEIATALTMKKKGDYMTDGLTDDQKLIYEVLRELCIRTAIPFTRETYIKVINRIFDVIKKVPSMHKAQETFAKTKKMNPPPPLDIFLAQKIIQYSAAYFLIEIQTHVPEYIPLYKIKEEGCVRDFSGYPIIPDKSQNNGITFVACIINNIKQEESVWGKSGIVKGTDDNIKSISGLIVVAIDSALKDSNILQDIQTKRQYESDTYGRKADDGRASEIIPVTFLPSMIMPTAEEAAEEPIIPEVTGLGNNSKNKQLLSKFWIRKANNRVKTLVDETQLARGNPYSEITCCPTNIQYPDNFWKSAGLPEIGERTLISSRQGSSLQVHFDPRPSEAVLAEAPEELYYRLFLKVCYAGPRIGYPHEPGLTNLCAWCGFQFPGNPTAINADVEGKAALDTASVEINRETYMELLDKVHRIHEVDGIDPYIFKFDDSVLEGFANISPSPVRDWNVILMETITNLNALPRDASSSDKLAALDRISNISRKLEDYINIKGLNVPIRDNSMLTCRDVILNITKLSWTNMLQVLQTYFIIPYNRIVNGFDKDSIKYPVDKKTDTPDVVKDFAKIFTNDNAVLTQYSNYKDKTMIKPNMDLFLRQLRTYMQFKEKIVPIIISKPGGRELLSYIQRIMLLGPITSLIYKKPIIDTGITEVLTSTSDILQLIRATLKHYDEQRLVFDDRAIKERVQIANEKEKNVVMAKIRNITDEDAKRVELLKKKLGIGDWAVGGSKAIWQFDADQYEKERMDRIKAGIVDFAESAVKGPEEDIFGFDMNGPAEEGYDMDAFNNHADDD
jgi:hypothetical protein